MKKLLLALASLFNCCCIKANDDTPKTFIVAHRGNSSEAPENTLAAFRSAWDNGINYVETDVYQTIDNEIICLHDNNLNRVSPGAGEKFVREMTLAEVKSFDVGSWKGEQFANEKVPTLEEFFAELPSHIKVFLEIKSVNDDFPLLLADLMKKYNIAQERIVIISFKEDALQNINKLTPGFKTNLLCTIKNSEENPEKLELSADDLIKKLKALGVSGVDANVGTAIDKKYISQVQKAGLEFHVWTIDKIEVAQKLYDAGINSITTNRPIQIKAELKIK
ncbi:MAG: glycerophosphodiester phosphodiesterase [Lentisphaeria bacterium]|nr:glycerophosphodiester phosphodiesterase [Lentisphaeria bacterium]